MEDRKGDFTGDRKIPLKSPLAGIEKVFVQRAVAWFPRWIEGYHLTLTTILWSAGIMAFGFLARGNVHWLWGASLMLVLQWFTDSLDGALGRRRNTGIPRWGFYMDHFLDFVFMACVFLQYVFLVGEPARYMLVAWAFVYVAIETSSWLAFAAEGEFKITYLGVGPTEIRALFVLVNALVVLFGVHWFEKALPYALGVSVVLCCVIVFRTQSHIWRIDMREKRNRR